MSKPAAQPTVAQLRGARRRQQASGRASEISFRMDTRNSCVELPPSLWTRCLSDGTTVRIRTASPVPLLGALCASAVAHGVELPEISVGPCTDEGTGQGQGPSPSLAA